MSLLKKTVICLPIFFLFLFALLLFKINQEKINILDKIQEDQKNLKIGLAQDIEKFEKLNKENFQTQISRQNQILTIIKEDQKNLKLGLAQDLEKFEKLNKENFQTQLSQQNKILNNIREDQKKLKLDLAQVLWAKYDGDKSYRFMTVGHAYTYPNSKSISNGLNPSFLKFMRASSLRDIRFIIFTGDFTYGGLPEQWDKVEEQMKEFPMDLNFVPGNHDLGGSNPGSQIGTFINRMDGNETSRSFFVGEDLFIILPGSPETKTPEQFEFLSNEIKKEHRYLFVFMHYIWWAKKFGIKGNTDVGISPWWNKVFSILKSTEKSVFIFGGDVRAKFDIVKVGNIRLISNGLDPGESPRNTVALVNVGEYGVDIIPTPISR